MDHPQRQSCTREPRWLEGRRWLDYTIPLVSRGELSLRGDYTYSAHVTLPGYHQDGYGLYNAAVEYMTEDGRWTFTGWAKAPVERRFVDRHRRTSN